MPMKNYSLIFLILLHLSCQVQTREAAVYLTSPSAGIYLEQQEKIVFEPGVVDGEFIDLNEGILYQEMEGFGFTLTQGSAQHLLQMNERARTELLQELFGKTDSDIGISYLRIAVGASDLSDSLFSYHDIEDGIEDPDFELFDFGKDSIEAIPILQEILAINPEVRIMASPWSPPVWMKDNKDTRGGSLLPENYESYARYLVKYIQKMAEAGITIDALTIQNEPLHPGNNPSLLMLADEQRDFIKYHLGPAFEANGVKTKIIIYDHNADRPDYPISILDDPEAKPYIHGSAFHLYAGKIEALSAVHKAHPDKHIYFTEQWIGAPGNMAEDLVWHIDNLIIGATRNWAKTVLEWNMSSNPTLTPYTQRGGCDRCLGAVTIDGDSVTRNPAYYILAHASKFVPPGSIRLDTNEIEQFANVAFLRPDGKTALILLNPGKERESISLRHKDFIGNISLDGGAVATVVM
jgi:glucosylceramidase